MMDRILQEPYEFINKQAEQIDKLKEQNAQYEFALKLLVDELNALKAEPCINCGQTEGEVYQGQPHDHVCPDCGREIPYNKDGE